jgi:hypothetical protein
MVHALDPTLLLGAIVKSFCLTCSKQNFGNLGESTLPKKGFVALSQGVTQKTLEMQKS